MHQQPPSSGKYIGRFAPSPTGPLHFGSLVAALASYLDARKHNGRWLVRMDDIDPPREEVGAADTILRQLSDHGLHWDGTVLYQSQRSHAYQDELQRLQKAGLAYPCDCSRQQVRAMGSVYNGHCRGREMPPAQDYAIRVVTGDRSTIRINDLFQGMQEWDLASTTGDFIIQRRDRLFAYQLACALDDIHQGITYIIRGSDLLDSTPRQIWLMQLSGATPPIYGHIPVVTDTTGQKLSKQNLAPAIDTTQALANLQLALAWLKHPVPPEVAAEGIDKLLVWAINCWDRKRIPSVHGLRA